MISMIYSNLLIWWIVSISWSALFLIAVSFYLYWKKRPRQRSGGRSSILNDFVFVWVLAGLLILYIVTINNRSSIVFAAGNISVEVVLILYTIKNRSRKTPAVD